MNFLFRFRRPGPLRIRVGSKGRVNADDYDGSFPAPDGIAGGRHVHKGIFFPITLEQFIRQAHAEGFTVKVCRGRSATVERRWMAGHITVVPGRGVVMRRTLSTWQILSLAGVVLLPIVCCLPGYLFIVSH
ncbi:hypothetical protein CSH63_05270 [Micromonospora tulbaghiae]|uniref:Uncharacterized protein n=1 Tax=Micromonospora tulbaghiae TaxID=479978 RepID=A0A386WHF1_9ACTN|nr:hypothetical protein [Micromonospora tulbaghiae]AYF26870.1 hypothetical protein CSH63_05270 [Micromonospora tulbaghiae]